MGIAARFQAVPEGCELLRRARAEREVAEMMEFFDYYAHLEARHNFPPEITEFVACVESLVLVCPALPERHFYAGGQHWDKILYLLSHARRTEDYANDQSLVRKAIRGCEPLHPEACATQGQPIGFVPAYEVHRIADYLDEVTYEQLYNYYDPHVMAQQGVYKVNSDVDERVYIWDEFTMMSNVYRAAADHNEAMIVVLD